MSQARNIFYPGDLKGHYSDQVQHFHTQKNVKTETGEAKGSCPLDSHTAGSTFPTMQVN